MNKIINHLRTFRKHTDITQYDISMLLELKGNTIVSRSEKGFKTPSLEMLVLYYLLFDRPLEKLISNHVHLFKEQLLNRIPKLIKEIEEDETSTNAHARIKYLKLAIERLNQVAS